MNTYSEHTSNSEHRKPLIISFPAQFSHSPVCSFFRIRDRRSSPGGWGFRNRARTTGGDEKKQTVKGTCYYSCRRYVLSISVASVWSTHSSRYVEPWCEVFRMSSKQNAEMPPSLPLGLMNSLQSITNNVTTGSGCVWNTYATKKSSASQHEPRIRERKKQTYMMLLFLSQEEVLFLFQNCVSALLKSADSKTRSRCGGLPPTTPTYVMLFESNRTQLRMSSLCSDSIFEDKRMLVSQNRKIAIHYSPLVETFSARTDKLNFHSWAPANFNHPKKLN